MRLLVTGSRTWTNQKIMWSVLDQIANVAAITDKDRYIKEGLTLVSGHAKGADLMAEAWFAERFPLEKPEVWKPDWKRFGKRAGIKRNEAMVDSHPDMCAAFIMPCAVKDCVVLNPHGSHGATHCATYAERAGIKVFRLEGQS